MTARGVRAAVCARPSERGFALLALVLVLIVASIWLAAVTPGVGVQRQRVAEDDFFFAGDQMAEGIARYYNRKLNPNGLVLGAPPPYGYLQELKKLRDGVTIGAKDVRFVRPSAFLDPITGEEWEPIRVGDPRVRKFVLAWARSTGRQIPPLYMSYMGTTSLRLDEIDEDDEDADEDEDEEGDSPVVVPPPQQADPGAPDGSGDDEDEDDWEDEEDEGDEGDEGASLLRRGGGGSGPFLAFALQSIQGGFGQTNSNANTNSGPRSRFNDPFASSQNNRRSTGPIIGVASKSKAKAVKTRYGLEHHNEILFIYMPAPARGAPADGGPFVDKNGDGINDSLQQNSINGPASGLGNSNAFGGSSQNANAPK